MNTRLNVADLNAIETRVGAWIAGCKPLMDVFIPRPGKPNGNDPYIDFGGTKLRGIPYEKLEADLKSKDSLIRKTAKDIRQMGKVGVLGCVYRMGGGGWGTNPQTGDTIKTGLWGYAEGYGVLMEQDQAHHVVDIFRESYSEIKQAWYDIENLIGEVLAPEAVRVKREFGPNGCIKIDKITTNQNGNRRHILRIQLPSGRFLHYMDAKLESCLMPWKDKDGNDVYRDSLTYSGIDQKNHTWKMGITSHGGKVFENVTQGIARDVLAVKMLCFEQIGMEVCGHVHDEGVSEGRNDAFTPGVAEQIAIMSEPVDWAPGLLLGADGFEGQYYHK
jgi:Casjensviridae DNA polymerase